MYKTSTHQSIVTKSSNRKDRILLQLKSLFNCQFKNNVKTSLSHIFTVLICFKMFFTLKIKKLLATSSAAILIY